MLRTLTSTRILQIAMDASKKHCISKVKKMPILWYTRQYYTTNAMDRMQSIVFIRIYKPNALKFVKLDQNNNGSCNLIHQQLLNNMCNNKTRLYVDFHHSYFYNLKAYYIKWKWHRRQFTRNTQMLLHSNTRTPKHVLHDFY